MCARACTVLALLTSCSRRTCCKQNSSKLTIHENIYVNANQQDRQFLTLATSIARRSRQMSSTDFDDRQWVVTKVIGGRQGSSLKLLEVVRGHQVKSHGSSKKNCWVVS